MKGRIPSIALNWRRQEFIVRAVFDESRMSARWNEPDHRQSRHRDGL